MKKGFDIHRIFVLTGIISLALIYLLLWMRTITTKREYDGADFMGLYSAARISQERGFPFIYDAEIQVDVQSQIVGYPFPIDQTSYFTHPAFIILLVNLIANENYTESLIRWMAILLLLNGASVFILMKSVSTLNLSRRNQWTLAIGAFLFLPTFSGFINGQDVILLLLGTSIWMFQLFGGKPFVAGLGLGLSAIRPQTAILLAAPFLIKGRKVFWGAILGGGILGVISLTLIGPVGLQRYFNILGVVEGGMWKLPHSLDMPTLSGLLRRTFGAVDRELFRYVIWSGYFAGLAIIGILWRKSMHISEKQVGLLILGSLLVVPYAHYHELTVLLIPIFCLIRILSAKGLLPNAWLAALPLAVSFVLLMGFIGEGRAKYLLVHAVMFLLAYLLIFPEKINALNRLRHFCGHKKLRDDWGE